MPLFENGGRFERDSTRVELSEILKITTFGLCLFALNVHCIYDIGRDGFRTPRFLSSCTTSEKFPADFVRLSGYKHNQ